MSPRAHCVSIIKTRRLMLFREMIAVYSDNHSKYQNSFCGQSIQFLDFKIGGAYTNRNYCVFKLCII